jgi:hypothetical protein
VSICVVGDPSDLTAAYVRWRAESCGIEVLALSESALGVDWAFAFDDLAPGNGTLEYEGRRRAIHELDGAFVRLARRPGLPRGVTLTPGQTAVLLTERRASLEHLLEALPCPVVNRPSAGRSHGSLPFQMARMAEAGFDVPRWIATGDLAAIWTFIGQSPAGAIHRSGSGAGPRGRPVDDEVLQNVRAGGSPILIQEHVPGRDVRVHTVGDRCFAAEALRDEADDLLEDPGARHSTSVPAVVERRCVRFARAEGLVLAGFDFRVTDDGRWLCLQMDPVPGFLPYEMYTGQPITDAVLTALVRRRSPRRTARRIRTAARAGACR